MNSEINYKESLVLQEAQGVQDIVIISKKAKRLKWIKTVMSAPKQWLRNPKEIFSNFSKSPQKKKQKYASDSLFTRPVLSYQIRSIPGNRYNVSGS